MPEEKAYPRTIIVPSNQEPTLLNDEALTGALIGSAVLDRNHSATGLIVGGLVGGMIGKENILEENKNGRKVTDPGSLGASVALSSTIGAALGGLLLVLSGPIGAIGTVGAVAVIGGSALLTGALGAVSHTQATKDYVNAKLYYDSHGGHYQGLAKEADSSPYKNSATAEEVKKLEERLKALEKKNHYDSTPSTALQRGA